LPKRRSAIVSVRSGRDRSGISTAASRAPGPGVTAFTPIPNRLVWLASARTNPARPGRASVSAWRGAWSYSPQTEDTATMRPERRSIMANTAARHRWNTPSRLVSMSIRQSASSSRPSGCSLVIPAQLTTAWTGPSSFSVSWNQEVTSVASVMSTSVPTARTPSSKATFSTWRADAPSLR
jgi:hypothetical protein